MSKQGAIVRTATITYTTKAQLLTSFIEVLKEQHRWESIAREMTDESLAVVRSNPLDSTWINARPLVEACALTMDLYGSAELRESFYRSTKLSTVRYLRPFLEATVRLFGVAPATLLSRLNQFVSHSTKGIELSFVASDAANGVLTFHAEGSKGLPLSALEMTAGSLRSIFDFTNSTGSCTSLKWLNAEQNTGELRIQWKSR